MAPYLSICVPTHDMPNGEFFLNRLKASLDIQTFRDFELVITKEGKMAENTNAAMRQAKGQYLKILYMDDYLAHPQSLQKIVDNLGTSAWLVTGCAHDHGDGVRRRGHFPTYTQDIHSGNNGIGSPSVLTVRNDSGLLFFDEKLSWLLDCDLYKRYYEKHGSPAILYDINVIIGVGDHQTTYVLTSEEKGGEHTYLSQKHG